MKAIKTRTYIGLISIIFLMVIINTLSNQIFRGLRLDLTDEKLYSLCDGSKNIVKNLKDNITIKYYFSSTDTQEFPSINVYGNNVLDILRSYERLSDNLKLEIYDPRPDSEESEWAEKYGIQGVQISTGDSIYFGMIILNEMGDEEVLPFLDPKREEFLEYDISKAISSVSTRKKPVVGLYSSLPLKGNESPQMPGQAPDGNQPWYFTNDLDQMFDVERLGDLSNIPEKINLLILIHPKELSNEMQFALDQYLLSGKSALIFIDPFCEADTPPNNPQNPMMAMSFKRSSSLPETLIKSGINLDITKVVLDAKRATKVQTAPGQLTDYYPWLSLTAQDINNSSVITGQLENLLMATPGFFNIDKEKSKDLQIIPLINSSSTAGKGDSGMLLFGGAPERISKSYIAGSEKLPLAIRVTGNIHSAFENKPTLKEGATESKSSFLLKSIKPLNVILVADVDCISNRFSLNVANFFGNLLISPINDNMNFFFNAVESLSGETNLISIRSRGKFSRPFSKVTEIEERAQAKWKNVETELVNKVDEANKKINSLMGGENEPKALADNAILQEVKKFRDEKKKTQKKLRDVRKNLRQEKEALGTGCFLTNTFLVPIMILLYGIYQSLALKNKAA